MIKREFSAEFDQQARKIIARIGKEARVLFKDGTDTGKGKVKINKSGNRIKISVGGIVLNGSRIESYTIFSCLKKERRLTDKQIVDL